MARALNDPSLYANADSLVMKLRAVVADVKGRPNRCVTSGVLTSYSRRAP